MLAWPGLKEDRRRQTRASHHPAASILRCLTVTISAGISRVPPKACTDPAKALTHPPGDDPDPLVDFGFLDVSLVNGLR